MSSAANQTTLVIKHRAIDREIQQEETQAYPNSLKLRELKVRKLRLKDRIMFHTWR